MASLRPDSFAYGLMQILGPAVPAKLRLVTGTSDRLCWVCGKPGVSVGVVFASQRMECFDCEVLWTVPIASVV